MDRNGVKSLCVQKTISSTRTVQHCLTPFRILSCDRSLGISVASHLMNRSGTSVFDFGIRVNE